MPNRSVLTNFFGFVVSIISVLFVLIAPLSIVSAENEVLTDPPELIGEVCGALRASYYRPEKIPNNCETLPSVDDVILAAGENDIAFYCRNTDNNERKTSGKTPGIPPSGKFGGIGMRYKIASGFPLVEKVFHDGPAEKAGLKEGDMILEIDGKTTSHLGYEAIASMIRGESQTEVALMAFRGGKQINLKIMRQTINVKSIQNNVSRRIDSNIVYINPWSYQPKPGSSQPDICRDIKDYRKKGVKGLILDLRTILSDRYAQYIAGAFLNKDTILGYKRTLQTQVPIIQDHDMESFGNIKLVVLINEETGIGAVLLAEALRVSLNAKIIGENSAKYGKLSGSYPVNNKAYPNCVLSYLSGELLTVKNLPVQDAGIAPDIIIEQIAVSPEDQVMEGAIEYLNKSF